MTTSKGLPTNPGPLLTQLHCLIPLPLGLSFDLASLSEQVLSGGKNIPNRAFSKDPALGQVVNLPFIETQESIFFMYIYVLFVCVCVHIYLCVAAHMYASMHTCVFVYVKAQGWCFRGLTQDCSPPY